MWNVLFANGTADQRVTLLEKGLANEKMPYAGSKNILHKDLISAKNSSSTIFSRKTEVQFEKAL